MQKKFKVTVTQDGHYNIEAIDFFGSSCVTESQRLKDELGVEVEDDRVYKPEFDLAPAIECVQENSISI